MCLHQTEMVPIRYLIHFVLGTILGIKGTIWNRWGVQIYEFGSPDYKWWDGNVEGVPSPDGVYFYILEAVDLQNKTHEFHGTVKLLR
jgi:hypothetical protein